jgi:hypothetical protein
MSLIKLFLGGNNLVFSRPERVWSVTSRLGTGKWLTLFYSVCAVNPVLKPVYRSLEEINNFRLVFTLQIGGNFFLNLYYVQEGGIFVEIFEVFPSFFVVNEYILQDTALFQM